MNYKTTTNLELNQVLTGIIFELQNWELTESGESFFMEDSKGEQHIQSVINYCTDWNATMPLAIEHNVELSPCFNGMYYAAIVESYTNEEEPHEYFCATINKDPLRAVVICLIKKLEQPR